MTPLKKELLHPGPQGTRSQIDINNKAGDLISTLREVLMFKIAGRIFDEVNSRGKRQFLDE